MLKILWLKKLLGRHIPKRLDIGSPEPRFCVFCGHKKASRRFSRYNPGTGDEVEAKWQYICFYCNAGSSGWY